MIGLVLLACHLVGDFVLQTRWQVLYKLEPTLRGFNYRTRHVAAYCLPFTPVAFVQAEDWGKATAFLLLLFTLHWLTDTRRFCSTLGDHLVWQLLRKREAKREFPGRSLRLKPNPWTALPVVFDQTLHIAQVAVLGWLLL